MFSIMLTNMLGFNMHYIRKIQFLKIFCGSNLVQKNTYAAVFQNGQSDALSGDVPPTSKEAVACFNKLQNLVDKHKWQIHSIDKWKGEFAGRHYGAYKDIDIYKGRFYYSTIENKAKALITYGPYSEGFFGHVHGGAIATLHDEVGGIVATLQGICVTANLTINYKSRILIGQTTLYSSELEKVEGRKIYIKSKVTCPEEKILYNEATALYIITNR